MNRSLLEHFGIHAHILRKSSHTHWCAPGHQFHHLPWLCDQCASNLGLTVKCSFAAVSRNSNMVMMLSHKACSAVENGVWECGVSVLNQRKVEVQWIVWGLCLLVTVPGQVQATVSGGQRVESGSDSLQP